MNASIIICTRNRAESLDQTLTSLHSVVIPAGLQPEVLVIDNGSSDATPIVAAKHGVSKIPTRHIIEPALGQSRARNTGLRESSGEIIIFTDDDLRFPKDWLDGICDPILQGKGHAVAGQIKLAPHLEREWMAQMHRSWCASSERFDPGKPDALVGANMAFARNVLEVVPAFDSELGPGALGFGDDTLFAKQILAAGRKICLSPANPVIHHFQEERLLRRSWLIAAEKMGRSQAYLYHHWRHQKTTRLHVRLCRVFLQYHFWRILKWRECSKQEGIPLWELVLLERLHRIRRYIALRKCPPNYDRHGLIKLRET